MNLFERYGQIYSIANISGNLYFKTYTYPGTYCLKKGECEVSLLPENEDPNNWNYGQFSDCVCYEDKIVFIPDKNADYISIYDTKTEKFEYIENIFHRNYKKGVVYGEYVYMFSEYVDGGEIARLNMKSMLFERVNFENQSNTQIILYHNTCFKDGKLYCPKADSDYQIVIFDFKNNKEQSVCISDFKEPIYTILYDGELFWLTGTTNKIYLWDEKSNKIVDTIELEPFFRNRQWDFWFIASEILGEYIYFAPIYYNKIIRINKTTHTVEKLLELDVDEACWSMCKINDGSLFIDISYVTKNESRNVIFSIDGSKKENIKELSIHKYYPYEYIEESDRIDLECFINKVTMMS